MSMGRDQGDKPEVTAAAAHLVGYASNLEVQDHSRSHAQEVQMADALVDESPTVAALLCIEFL